MQLHRTIAPRVDSLTYVKNWIPRPRERYVVVATTVSLGALPLFAGLDPADLVELQSRMRRLPLERGQTLFLEGDEAAGFYLVRSGRLKVYKSSSSGREQILHFVGPGEPVGEVVMFAGGRLPASAEALENTEVLLVPRQAFLELVKGKPEVAMKFLASLSQRLRFLATLVENLSLREVAERVAGYLLYLNRTQSDTNRVELDLSRGEMASLFGTVPETLSRALLRLTQDGVLEIDRRTVVIRDKQALEDIAWAGRRL